MSVYDTTRFTALASGDVIGMVDISDATQSAHGSFDSITVTNFFNLIPVNVGFGAAWSTISGIAAPFQHYVTSSNSAMWVRSGNNTSAVVWDTLKNRGASASALATVVAGDTLFSFGQQAIAGDNSTHATAATLQVVVPTSGVAATTVAGEWRFMTTNLAGSYANRLRITSEGSLVFDTAVSQIVAGATSIAFRNAADNANNLLVADAGTVTGRTSITATTFLGYTTTVISTTALATPGALGATQFTGFASTVSGASIMGYGTTNDVALMNRAGTVCLGIGPNTTAVTIAGSLNGQTISATAAFTGTMSIADDLSLAKSVKFTANTSLGAAGSIGREAAGGLTLWAVTGSVNDFAIYNAAGSATYVMRIPTGTSNVVWSGAHSGFTTLGTTGAITSGTTIATADPTGGAGLWKLGIANAVSPTSPNRTLTVDIGGTLYYIHAKTTNN